MLNEATPVSITVTVQPFPFFGAKSHNEKFHGGHGGT